MILTVSLQFSFGCYPGTLCKKENNKSEALGWLDYIWKYLLSEHAPVMPPRYLSIKDWTQTML